MPTLLLRATVKARHRLEKGFPETPTEDPSPNQNRILLLESADCGGQNSVLQLSDTKWWKKQLSIAMRSLMNTKSCLISSMTILVLIVD